MLGLIESWFQARRSPQLKKVNVPSLAYFGLQEFTQEVRRQIAAYLAGVAAYHAKKRPNPPIPFEVLTVQASKGVPASLQDLPGAQGNQNLIYFIGSREYISYVSCTITGLAQYLPPSFSAFLGRGELSCYQRFQPDPQESAQHGCRRKECTLEHFIHDVPVPKQGEYYFEVRQQYRPLVQPASTE